MNYKLAVLRVMEQYGWSRAFSYEYVMARHYHGMSHAAAIREARRSPYVRAGEFPRG